MMQWIASIWALQFIFLSSHKHSKTPPIPRHECVSSPAEPLQLGSRNTRKQLHQLSSWQSKWCNALHRVSPNKFQPNFLIKSWFSGRDEDRNFSVFRVRAFTESPDLWNCLSCRNPYHTPHSLNCLPPFSLKSPFFHWKVLRRIPFPEISLDWCM